MTAKRCRNRREVEVCGTEEGSEGLKSGDTRRDDQSWRIRRRGGAGGGEVQEEGRKSLLSSNVPDYYTFRLKRDFLIFYTHSSCWPQGGRGHAD